MNLKLNFESADPLYAQVEHFLRLQIQEGKLKPGERLPSTQELCEKWGVGTMAVQKAMALLTADGLIERRPMKGTFIKSIQSSIPIALLVRANLTLETEYFLRSIVHYVRILLTESCDRCVCHLYDDLGDSPPSVKHMSPAYQRLATDSRSHSFKGIMAFSVDLTKVRKVIPFRGLPSVDLNLAWPKARSDVVLDLYHFGREVMAYIAEQGYRSMLYFRTIMPSGDEDLRALREGVKSLGLPAIDVMQFPDKYGPDLEHLAYMNTMRIVADWQSGNSRRPDALLVSDDIATRGVVLALMRKTMDTPSTASSFPALIAMTNHEIPHPYEIPVARYEISTKKIATLLVGLLQRRMRGDPVSIVPTAVKNECAIRCYGHHLTCATGREALGIINE
jgi:DNA-binding transcriptional regulator YhcF (GntR family)/DNA-binding LacI/PurR family transcriptional regulator